MNPLHYEMTCMEVLGGVSANVQSVICPGLDIWISTQPYQGEPTGGDVHFISLCGGGISTRIVLADVSGHGSHVYEYSEFLRNLVKRHINAKSQSKFMAEINRSFAEYAQLSRFATSVFGTYIATKKTLELCIAGHPRPVLYKASTGQWKYLGESAKPDKNDLGITNLPIGIDDEADFETFHFEFGLGDYLIFYSDSLTESKSSENQFLAESGLIKIMQTLEVPGIDVQQLGQSVLSGVSQFRNQQPADDDESIIVIHHNGNGPKHIGFAEKVDVYAKFFGLKNY